MKEITADFIRQEINRLGGVIVETALYHPSGIKLHSSGDVLTLTQAKQLHEAFVLKLHLLDVGEDEWSAKKKLAVEHVIPSRVEAGDQLADDLRSPSGGLLLPAGTTIDADALQKLQTAAVLAVPIRHRKAAALEKNARDYLALNPPAAPAPKESVTRIARAAHSETSAIRTLLIPQAKVLVSITDDLVRTLVINALTSEGHQVIDGRPVAEVLRYAEKERPHLVILNLDEAIRLLPVLREDGGLRRCGIFVYGDPAQAGALKTALMDGANDWLHRPPSRKLLSDKVTGYQALVGRKVGLPPTLRQERRRFPRQTAKVEISLKDPRPGKPLPVSTVELLDSGEGGIRADYNLPAWPYAWAYSVHGVHPRHFWYEFAKNNPLGRELIVRMPGPRGTPVEKAARVTHVAPAEDLEIIGLCFAGVQDAAPPKPAATRKF